MESIAEFQSIERTCNKKVMHIAAAAGNSTTQYAAPDILFHSCPMYYKGDRRSAGIHRFWMACKEAAREGKAVLIHCNQSFHRGPILLLAIMIFAGQQKAKAMQSIADQRIIYSGHTVPFSR